MIFPDHLGIRDGKRGFGEEQSCCGRVCGFAVSAYSVVVAPLCLFIFGHNGTIFSAEKKYTQVPFDFMVSILEVPNVRFSKLDTRDVAPEATSQHVTSHIMK